MSEIENNIINNFAETLVAKQDDVLCQIIEEKTGKHWSVINLFARVKKVRKLGETFEVILLDGKPIMEIHDPVMELVNNKHGVEIVGKINYRRL